MEAFGVDLSGLVLDMTNFATYIDSANELVLDRPAGSRPNRNAPTCAWSAWDWWSPPTAASR